MSKKRVVNITRTETGDDGTFGQLTTDRFFQCYTLELPWRGNASELSCIPAGTYTCSWRKSAKHGMCYHVDGVKGRTEIQIHSANWAGDSKRGLKCQLLGCIAPGRAIGELDGQKAVLSSVDALHGLENDLERKDFELIIVERFEDNK